MPWARSSVFPRTFGGCLALVLLLGTGMPAAAQELRLLAAELLPYTYHEPPPTISEDGRAMGIVDEAVREMARRVGHSGTIEYMPWARAQELAMRGPRVGILALTRSPERDARYRWVQRILTDDLVLAGRTGIDAADPESGGGGPTRGPPRGGAEGGLPQRGI